MRRVILRIKLSLRNVFRNRRRSLLALTTIAMGAAGLFIFMGFNRGLMNQYRDNTIRARWGHGQLYLEGYRTKAQVQPSALWIDHPERVMGLLRHLPGVVDLFPRLTLQAILVAGSRSVVGQGEGIDGPAEARFFNRLNYVEGGDILHTRDGIVLGRGLAEGLGVHVGDTINLLVQHRGLATQNVTVTVRGIFNTGSHELDNRLFRVPIRLAQTLLQTDKVESIAVALTSVNDWAAFAARVRTILPQLEAVSFDELDRVYYRHAVDWLDSQFAFIRVIIVVVVFLGIFNSISMAIMERTVEIGALRANGESRLQVVLGMILETAALGIGGSLLGLATGWLLCLGPFSGGIPMPPAPGITRSFRIFIELSPTDGIQVIVLCLLTAVGGCGLPVARAVRMPIAKALRHT